MIQFILASHGDLAQGMKSTLKMLTGMEENIFAFGLQEGGNVLELAQKICDIIETRKDRQTIILTDIAGGSVNNQLMEYANKDNVHLVAGMNLPLVLNLALESEINVQVIKVAVVRAKESVSYFVEPMTLDEKGEEDFFD